MRKVQGYRLQIATTASPGPELGPGRQRSKQHTAERSTHSAVNAQISQETQVSETIIPSSEQISNLQALTWTVYREIADISRETSVMMFIEDNNPRWCMIHQPTGWKFTVEWCSIGEPFAFAICPKTAVWFLLDGPPARSIIEMLAPICAEDYYACAE